MWRTGKKKKGGGGRGGGRFMHAAFETKQSSSLLSRYEFAHKGKG